MPAALVAGVGVDMALEHDLRLGRHLQRHAQRVGHLGARAAQEASKLVFGQSVGHGGDRAQDGRWVRANGHGHGVGLAGVLAAMLGKVQRPAAVREPAHDELVPANHLLAVDAEVLPWLVRPARDGQAPGDERRHVAGPAMLYGQACQIDLGALPHDLLAGRAGYARGRHAPQGLEQVAPAPEVLDAARRLGLLELGQHLAKGADFGQTRHAQRARHAAGCAEQVGQHRHAVARGVFKQQGRAARAQHAVGKGRHLQVRRDRGGNAAQLACGLQLGHEVTQVAVGHGQGRLVRCGPDGACRPSPQSSPGGSGSENHGARSPPSLWRESGLRGLRGSWT